MHLGEDSAADDEDDGAPAQAAAVGVRLPPERERARRTTTPPIGPFPTYSPTTPTGVPTFSPTLLPPKVRERRQTGLRAPASGGRIIIAHPSLDAPPLTNDARRHAAVRVRRSRRGRGRPARLPRLRCEFPGSRVLAKLEYSTGRRKRAVLTLPPFFSARRGIPGRRSLPRCCRRR